MLLNKEQILAIINKEPKKLRNTLTNEIINSYEYLLDEQLDLIQTYIYFVKGIDVGNMAPPKGEMCSFFIHLAISKGINPMLAMGKGSDLEAANLAMDVSIKYFKDKYNENIN